MGKIIDLVPGSNLWHEYRKTHVMASQSSIILGINKWQTPYSLYEEKMYGKKLEMNPSMQRGLDLEPIAIKWAEKHFDTILSSRVIEHSDYSWKACTVDGISPGGNIVVEVKFANAKVHTLAQQGELIDYYQSQVQSQIACCDVEEAYFISCYQQPGCDIDFVLVVVPRDQPYIDNMIIKEQEFYEKCIVRKEPPELVDKDFEHVKDNLGFDYHCEAYLEINKTIADLEKQKKYHHENILDMAKDRNSRSDSFKASKFKVKGSVDTKRLYDSYEITDEVLDIYRKEDREQWRITKNKETP